MKFTGKNSKLLLTGETPRKEVKPTSFLSSKKTLEAFASGFTGKKESSRVLNMKDMNSKNLQLSNKINNCFGDFYKKLDTFADSGKKINEF